MKLPAICGGLSSETWWRLEREITTSGFHGPSLRVISRESSSAKASNEMRLME